MRAHLLIIALHLSCSKSHEHTEATQSRAPALNLSAVQATAQPSLHPHHEHLQKPTNRDEWYSAQGQLHKIDRIVNELKSIDTETFPQEWRRACTKTMGTHSDIGFGIDGIIALTLASGYNDDLTYEHIIKNPRKKAGYPWSISGRISMIREINEPPMTIAKVQLDGNSAQEVVVIAKLHTKFIQGNYIDAIGYIADNELHTDEEYIITPVLAAVALSNQGSIKNVYKYSKTSLSKQKNDRQDRIVKALDIVSSLL